VKIDRVAHLCAHLPLSADLLSIEIRSRKLVVSWEKDAVRPMPVAVLCNFVLGVGSSSHLT